MTEPSIFIALLWLNGHITFEEAEWLRPKMSGHIIPPDWKDVIAEIENCIGRKLTQK